MATQTGTPMGTKQIYEMMHVSWGWLMSLGIIMLIVGSLAIVFPAATSVSIEVLLGILLLILGGLIWAGLPSSAAWAIGLLVGIQLLLEGWMLIMASVAVHAEETHGHMPMTA